MIDRNERLALLLQDALLIAAEAGDPGLLQHLSDARSSVRAWAADHRPIEVDLLSGRVIAGGLVVRLTKAEFALITALSASPRGVCRETLAEDLYPGAPMKSAINNIKVYVHRVRRRMGSYDVIRYDDGRYVLGNSVRVELFCFEAEVRRLRVELAPLPSDTRERLEIFHRRLRDGRPLFMLEWDWFEQTERRLQDLTRDVAMLLAEDALRGGRLAHAVAMASALSEDDPLDEGPRELLIRACALTGNGPAALDEYRRYAGVLRREIDAAPSDALRDLVGGLAVSR